ncbi:MAG: glycosyltransferase, partial [Candidatus Eremiobacteraeota bacterium]|nr:glycosyltransferase [Candidatus Eremiobacteraeota bacterium]
ETLADALRGAGHDVLCVTPMMPGYDESNASVLRVPSLPLPVPTAYRLALPVLPDRKLAPMMRRPSVVHTHSPFITGWLGLRTARRYGVPLVFTYHTRLEDYAHYVPFEPGMTRRAALRLTKTYANAADAVIVPTRAMETHLREIGVRARIDVVPGGIDVAAFARGRRSATVRRTLGVAANEKMVLCVCRLAREKNVELAIDTMLAAPRDARLVIVGDGPHAPQLRRFAMRAGVAHRVTFAGELPRVRLPDVYASADAFLFTSSSETQGLVLAEALAAALPLVAVDTAATRDVLARSGFVVPGEPRVLAAALEEALRLQGRGQSTEVWRFERHRVADQVLAVYRSLLEARATG